MYEQEVRAHNETKDKLNQIPREDSEELKGIAEQYPALF